MVKEKEIDEERLRKSLEIALNSLGDVAGISPESIPSADEFMNTIEGKTFWRDVFNIMTGGSRKKKKIHRTLTGKSFNKSPRHSMSISKKSLETTGWIQRKVLDYIVSLAKSVIGLEKGTSVCSTIMTFINIASWSAFVYLLISSSMGLVIGTEISKFISGPIHYFISQIPEIEEGMEEFTMGAVISFVTKLYVKQSIDSIPDIVNAVGYIASMIKINGDLYEELVMEPVACAISPVIYSCAERCIGKRPSYGRGITRKHTRRFQRRGHGGGCTRRKIHRRKV